MISGSGTADLEPANPAGKPLSPEYHGLKRPAPGTHRNVAANSLGFMAIWISLSAVFVVLGMGAYFRDLSKYNRLTQEGVPVKATITRRETLEQNDSYTYYVFYQFSGRVQGNTQNFDGSESVAWAFYHTLQDGQSIDVVYAASDPVVSTLKHELVPPGFLRVLIFGGVGGLSLLSGVAIFIAVLKERQNRRRLQSEGLPAQAIVFDRWQERRIRGDVAYQVAFAFKAPLPEGSLRMFASAEGGKELYDACQTGDTIPVRYLPDNPSICTPWVEK